MAHIGRIDNCDGVQFDFNSNDAVVSRTTSVAIDYRRPSDVRFRLVVCHQCITLSTKINSFFYSNRRHVL